MLTRWNCFLLVFVIVLLDYVNGEEKVGGGVVRKRMGHKRKQVSYLFFGFGYDVWRMMRKFVFFGVGVAGSRDDLSANERICIRM